MTRNCNLYWIGRGLAGLAAGIGLVVVCSLQPASALTRLRIRGRCQNCHKASTDEWKESGHRNAWKDPLFVKLTNNYEKKECLGCHAPDSIHTKGLGNPPEVRESIQDSGVDCAVCHRDAEDTIHGAQGLESQDHVVKKDPALGTVTMCASCHAKYGTVDEFKQTKHASDPRACVDCHMEEVERPIAKDTPPRKARKHSFAASTNKELVAKHLSLSGAVDGGDLVVKLTSKDVGHMIPTGHDTRVIIIDVTVKDGGATVAEKRVELTNASERGGKDTRLGPDATVTVKVPLGGKHGKASIRLLHKGHFEQSDDEATVMLATEIDL